MPLTGLTTLAEPGRVFTPQALLDYLASSDNQTQWTYAMGRLVLARDEAATGKLNVASLASTCPREFWLRTYLDYTLELESLGWALVQTWLWAMVASVPTNLGAEENALRGVTYGKRVDLPDGSSVVLPARLGELLPDYDGPGQAHLRDYQPALRSLPRYDVPFSTHALQLNLRRWVLSPFPSEPLRLPNGVEFWEPAAERLWEPAEPVNVVSGEVVYLSGAEAKRTYLGRGSRTGWMGLPYLNERVAALLPAYRSAVVTPYQTAIASPEDGGYGFRWKCEHCPVRAQCWQHYTQYEVAPAGAHRTGHSDAAPF